MQKKKKIVRTSIAFIIVIFAIIGFCNVIYNNDIGEQELTDEVTSSDTESIKALAEAKNNNSDTVAWLRVTGTDINNPVMQTANNSDYLHLDEDGVYSIWGAYFADYYANLTSPSSLIQNTVIYGHSENPENSDGKKFSQLFRYSELEFMLENPYLYLTIDDEIMVYEIFAVFYTDIDFYYINPSPNNDDFDNFINTVKEKNEYLFYDITVTEQDKIITLSTCSHKYDEENTGDHRFVIMGKLVDSDTDSVSNILLNPSPERP